MGGIFGGVLVGFFANPDINPEMAGAFYGNPKQVVATRWTTCFFVRYITLAGWGYVGGIALWVDLFLFLGKSSRLGNFHVVTSSLPETPKENSDHFFDVWLRVVHHSNVLLFLQIGPRWSKSGIFGLSRLIIVKVGGIYTVWFAAAMVRSNSVVDNLVLISGNSNGVKNLDREELRRSNLLSAD